MKYIVSFFGLIMMCILVVFFIQIQDTTAYQQTVNYTIEREGGLTDSALNDLEKESADNYGGKVAVVSDDSGVEKKFGEIVDYEIKQTFSFHFFRDFSFTVSKKGNAVSQVRKFN